MNDEAASAPDPELRHELRKEARGPEGNPARHLSAEAIDAGMRALIAPPADVAELVLIVRRRADGLRETPERVVLTPDEACRATVGIGDRHGNPTRNWR